MENNIARWLAIVVYAFMWPFLQIKKAKLEAKHRYNLVLLEREIRLADREAVAKDRVLVSPPKTRFREECISCGARYEYSLVSVHSGWTYCPSCDHKRIHIASNAIR